MKRKSDQNPPPGRTLDSGEEALWQKVRRTVLPIDDKRQNLKHWLDEETGRYNAVSPVTRSGKPDTRKSTGSVTMPGYSPPVSKPASALQKKGLASAIDDRTAKKLLKGRVSIDARIDLHGMSQVAAHNALKNFLHDCHLSGFRMVLVITGKGRDGEGVLRRAVPAWLSEPPLSLYVSAYRISHVTHGGEGALYVRIRKRV